MKLGLKYILFLIFTILISSIFGNNVSFSSFQDSDIYLPSFEFSSDFSYISAEIYIDSDDDFLN
ncbi:MAG: hypothetical protein ACXABJ_11030, partial [Candidatus Heimdallarchaeaceae archaeon]